MGPIVRAGASFVIVLMAYGVYALTAVPLIEPASEALGATTAVPLPPLPVSEIDPADRMYRWFGPDRHAWELQKPKMLRNDQGILLFDKYVTDETLGPKKVRLEPVSLVFLSEDRGLDPQVRDRQAVIMRAPTGAVLEFDRPFNIVRGDVGRLVGGTLTGKVVIHSEGKSPGPEDDLRIVTEDVKLTMTSITTSYSVDFEYGPNRGKGTELDIRLLPEDEHRDSPWGRIQSLTLKRDISLDLIVEQRSEKSAGSSPLARLGGAPAASGREFSPEQPIVVAGGSPVTVRCRGPFEFSALENVAAFERRVVVTRQQPAVGVEIPPDKLTCHRLELHLAAPENKPAAKVAAKTESPSRPHSVPKLEVRRVVAIGLPEERGVPQNVVVRPAIPAVLEAPGSQAFARGHRLEYNLETRQVSLVDHRESVFQHGTNEIHARELHYQPGADGRLGRLEAEGTGWLNWEARDLRGGESGGITAQGSVVASPAADAPGEARRFLARWGRKLFSVPSEGRQVISMLGEAKARVTGMGQLDAEEIHAWLIEQPQPAAADANGQPQKQKFDLLPDRMLALSAGKDAKVAIDSPQLTGRTDKLEIFVQRADEAARRGGGPGGAAAAGPTGGPLRDPQPRAAETRPRVATSRAAPANGALGNDAAAPSQRFDVTGRWVQVQVIQIGGQTQWRQVDLIGAARLVETETAKPGERPFEVTGDFVRAQQPEPDAARVTVKGKKGEPAHVEGRGLSLTGAAIDLDQRANLVWIDGSGMMTLLVDRDLQGERLGRPSPVEITWQRGMQFNGQEAVFDQGVLVKQEQATLRTQNLRAVLSQRIDMAHPKQGGSQRPQIDRIICQEGLVVERLTSDARGPLAHEKLVAADLTIDQVSGAIFGQGPGWLTRVYRRDGELESPAAGGRPGGAAAPAAKAAGPGGAPFAPPPDPDKPLNYLRVDFQFALQGNTNLRTIQFSDQVQAVHAPVRTWEDTVNPDRVELLGPRGVVLKCDELHLNQMCRGQEKWFEASARRNVKVEGESFDAVAERLDYTQEKDVLVLQGTDRAPAQIWQQQGVGAERTHLEAREIEFDRRSNHIKITRARYLDVNNIPSDKGRSRPRPGALSPR
jgi:hypothetical protein